MKIASVAEVKSQFSAFVKSSADGPVVVTRNGKPVAVLVGVEDEDEIERLLMAYSPRLRAICDLSRQQTEPSSQPASNNASANSANSSVSSVPSASVTINSCDFIVSVPPVRITIDHASDPACMIFRNSGRRKRTTVARGQTPWFGGHFQ